jgi:hypothetical protein
LLLKKGEIAMTELERLSKNIRDKFEYADLYILADVIEGYSDSDIEITTLKQLNDRIEIDSIEEDEEEIDEVKVILENIIKNFATENDVNLDSKKLKNAVSEAYNMYNNMIY